MFFVDFLNVAPPAPKLTLDLVEALLGIECPTTGTPLPETVKHIAFNLSMPCIRFSFSLALGRFAKYLPNAGHIPAFVTPL